MTAILNLELGAEALEKSLVDLAVAGIFRDEVPLRGGAGRMDWRLCGLVSDQILAARIRGARGEALLIPSTGAVRANKMMLLGLGVRSEYRLQLVEEGMQQAVSRAVALASPSLAVSPLGIASDEFTRCVPAIVGGAITGFEASIVSLRLRIVIHPAELNRAAQAIAAYLGTVAAPKLRFEQETARSFSSKATWTNPQQRAEDYRSSR